MPQGIRSRKERFDAFLRPCADGVRAVALGLLFLLLWMAALGPAAMAMPLPAGVTPPSLHIEHGGETPPAQETPPSLLASRTAQRPDSPAADLAPAALVLPAMPAPRRRRLPRHVRPAIAPPRHGPPRRQHRGRAPPR